LPARQVLRLDVAVDGVDVVYPVAVTSKQAVADTRKPDTRRLGDKQPGGKGVQKPCPVTGVPNSYRRFSYLMPEARTPENLAKFKGGAK